MLVILSLLLGVLLVTFVAPIFAEMFSGFGAELPKPTQLLFEFSDFTKSWFFLLQVVIAGVVGLFFWVLDFWDRRKRKILMCLVTFIPVCLILVLLMSMFLPIFLLSSVVG